VRPQLFLVVAPGKARSPDGFSRHKQDGVVQQRQPTGGTTKNTLVKHLPKEIQLSTSSSPLPEAPLGYTAALSRSL